MAFKNGKEEDGRMRKKRKRKRERERTVRRGQVVGSAGGR